LRGGTGWSAKKFWLGAKGGSRPGEKWRSRAGANQGVGSGGIKEEKGKRGPDCEGEPQVPESPYKKSRMNEGGVGGAVPKEG